MMKSGLFDRHSARPGLKLSAGAVSFRSELGALPKRVVRGSILPKNRSGKYISAQLEHVSVRVITTFVGKNRKGPRFPSDPCVSAQDFHHRRSRAAASAGCAV